MKDYLKLICAYAIALILLFCMSGCNAVNKASQNKSEVRKESSVIETSSAQTNELKRDSEGVKTDAIELVNTKVKGESVAVEFYRDTTEDNMPVVIIRKGDSISVDGGSRKLKSLRIESEAKHAESISNTTFEKIATSELGSSSASTSGKEAVQKEERKKVLMFSKKSFRLPAVILIAAGILLIIYLRKRR